jgi:hypothetical protein
MKTNEYMPNKGGSCQSQKLPALLHAEYLDINGVFLSLVLSFFNLIAYQFLAIRLYAM